MIVSPWFLVWTTAKASRRTATAATVLISEGKDHLLSEWQKKVCQRMARKLKEGSKSRWNLSTINYDDTRLLVRERLESWKRWVIVKKRVFLKVSEAQNAVELIYFVVYIILYFVYVLSFEYARQILRNRIYIYHVLPHLCYMCALWPTYFLQMLSTIFTARKVLLELTMLILKQTYLKKERKYLNVL